VSGIGEMFIELLRENKDKIASIWTDQVLATYSKESALVLKKNTDPFANPMGSSITSNLGQFTDWLLNDYPIERIFKALDSISRIRSVQEFTASQAISFVFLVKKVVRELFAKELKKSENVFELLSFESKVDQLALYTFDVYSSCREDAFNVRRNEVNRRMAMYEKAIKHINHGLNAHGSSDDTVGEPSVVKERQGGGTA